MPRLRDNVLANYVGQAWIALMGLAFVPLYLRILGPEQFGMVTFMLTLQAVSLLLDMGVSIFMSRELARRAHDPGQRSGIRDLVRSFEWLVWPTAVIVGFGIFAGSDAIARHWLNADLLGPNEATSSVRVIGLVVALLWPTSFYAAALSGLERQGRLNALVVLFATLRFAGVVPVLYLTNGELSSFLWWHALVAVTQTLCTGLVLWHALPAASGPPRFRLVELLTARRFAFGVFGVTALGLALSQMDRIVLSALRSLQELGYYGVALALSGGLGRLVQPVFAAIYPRLSHFVARKEADSAAALYHLASQLVTVVVAAVAGVVCLYAESILVLWTGDPVLASRIALPLAILFAGTAINGIMQLPYAFQLSHGWTTLAFRSNLVATVAAVPAYILAIQWQGMIGAAWVWLAVNMGYMVVTVPLMHRRLLPADTWRWYARDVLTPAAAAIAVVLAAKVARPIFDRDLMGIIWLFAVTAGALLAALMATREPRRLLLDYVRVHFKR